MQRLGIYFISIGDDDGNSIITARDDEIFTTPSVKQQENQ